MNLRGYLVTGIAAVVPLAATIYILLYLTQLVDGISQPVVEAVLGRSIPGLGLLITLTALIGVGVFVSYTVGMKAAELVDATMRRIPLSRSIYSIIKDVSDTFLSGNREFGNVVLLRLMPDVYMMGFLGSRSPPEADSATSQKLVNVFVPTSPSPMTGFVLMVSEDRIAPLDMNVDRGMQIIVSAGFTGDGKSP